MVFQFLRLHWTLSLPGILLKINSVNARERIRVIKSLSATHKPGSTKFYCGNSSYRSESLLSTLKYPSWILYNCDAYVRSPLCVQSCSTPCRWVVAVRSQLWSRTVLATALQHQDHQWHVQSGVPDTLSSPQDRHGDNTRFAFSGARNNTSCETLPPEI